nr:E3 ubiquitin-protein ligase TRIM32-like [Nerophis lumbriciformis]
MEQQQAGVDEMNQELDSAVINAEKEERRLLEKVERHHRKAQQLLSQVRRENTAAMRVVQSLVDQQLQKMARLKEQLKRWGSSAGGAEKLQQLQEGVEEVTKPWEICLTLKRVSYTPNSQSQMLSLGEVEVHEQAKFSGKLCSTSPANKSDCGAIRKVNRMRLASKHSSLEQSHRLSTEPEPDRKATRAAIVGEDSQRYKNEKKEKDAASFRELVEERGSTLLDSAYLVKQFGKQGSGRTDFNLPSGLHATVNGQLFVVDCGNARIQVTDAQKNFVQQVSPSGTERSSRICNYFDVAVNSKGLIALTCAAERAVLVFSRHGRLLQTFGGMMSGSNNEELDAPRGVTLIRQDEFLVADIKRGTLTALKLDPKTGARLERTVVTGYHRPYMVAACLTTGLMAVSERGNETGRVACIRVLEPGWTTIRILGVCSGLGPVLSCPWGLCIDSDGNVLVADWGKQNHRVLLYTSTGVGWPVVTEHLNNPRGLALLPDGHMVISDSMNHSIKIYRYKLN